MATTAVPQPTQPAGPHRGGHGLKERLTGLSTRARIVLAAAAGVVAIVLALAGGGGGGEQQAVASAATSELSKATDLHVGLNSGMLVGVRSDLVSYFQLGEKKLDNIKLSGTKITGDRAKASVSFRVTSATAGGAAQCKGGVVLSKSGGGWDVMALIVANCTSTAP